MEKQGRIGLDATAPRKHDNALGLTGLAPPPDPAMASEHQDPFPDNASAAASGLESPDARLAKVVRVAALLDYYGELLTDRQRRFVELHFEEDLSFAEIADQFSVSRQAAHDAVKSAVAALENYEEKLKLLARNGVRMRSGAAEGPSLTQVAERLERLHDTLRRSGGILYDTGTVIRELGEAIAELRHFCPDQGPAPAAESAQP